MDDPGVCKVRNEDCCPVIEEVSKYWCPEGTCPQVDVAEHNAQHHSWKQSIELNMNCSKEKCRKDYRNMDVLKPFSKEPLEEPPEQHLLSYGRDDCDHQHV